MKTQRETPGATAAASAHQQHRRRLLLAYDCYNVATNTGFTSAVWVIYLAVHGYNPVLIGLFETLFHSTKFVAEIPTGIFADLVGRRRSLLISCLLNALSALLLIIPLTPLIALSFVCSGLAFAFRGGADEALLWGLAARLEPQEQRRCYSHLISRMYALATIGDIIGTMAGGWLGQLFSALPFLCQAALTLLGAIPLLLLPEQRGAKQQTTHPLRHLGRGLQAVAADRALLALLLLSGLIEGCSVTIYYYNQLYLHALGFALASVGLTLALCQVLSAGSSALAPRIMRRIAVRWLLPLLVAAQVAGLLAMSLSPAALGLSGFLLLPTAGAVLAPVLSTCINERCPEEQRATVLSLQTGLFSGTMVVLFPLFGLGLMHIDYSLLYRGTAALLGGGALVALAVGLRRRSRSVA